MAISGWSGCCTLVAALFFVMLSNGSSQECFSLPNCQGTLFPSDSAKDCCVGSNEGLSFSDEMECTVPQCIVHGFPVVSYTVSEGDTLDVTFGLNVKGNTRFQALVHSILAQGNVTAERVRAGSSDLPTIIKRRNITEDIFQLSTTNDISLEYDDQIMLTFTPLARHDYYITLIERDNEYIRKTTTFNIIDNDVAVVGLEETLYHVTEGVGVVEVCAIVYEPIIDCPIAFPFNTSLSTDVTRLDPSVTILMFGACEKKSCVNVSIESFNVNLERTPGLDRRITLHPVEGLLEGSSRGCFSLPNCQGTPFPSDTAKDCCVGSNEGLSFSDGTECTVPQCIVHGFPVVSYNVSEGNTLDTTFGLNMKGRTRFPSLLLAGYVTAEADTAGSSDFEFPPIPSSGTAVDIQLSATDDKITLEYNDRIMLIYTPQTANFIELVELAGEFIRDTTTVNIIDNDILEINFEEADYSIREGDRLTIPIRMQYRKIQVPITLMLSVVSIEVAEAVFKVGNFIESDTIEQRFRATPGSDFTEANFTILIPADSDHSTTNPIKTHQFQLPINVINDSVNEINESFALVAKVEDDVPEDYVCFQRPTSDAGCFGRVGAIKFEIIDNDMAVVGLEETLYHVTEGVGVVEVCAIVYNPVIDCPVAFPFNISLSTSVTPLDPSTILMFSACEKKSCVNVSIESFNVNLERMPGLNRRITLHPVEGVLFDASVEFEQAVYTVMEDAGSVQVCAVKRGEITTEELLLTLYTEDDTAHAARDYKHVEIDAVISEKVCIDIPIINNFLPGNTIQFTLTATSSSHSIVTAPSIVIIMDDEIPRGCTYEVLNSSVIEEEIREEVVIEIAEVLESIGIPNITAVFSTHTPLEDILAGSGEISAGNETTDQPLKTVYRAIAKEFEVETTEEGYDNFAEAVSQITEAKIAACEDSASVSEDDVPRLASEYRGLKEDVVANIIEMRNIFGKMLCLSERDHEERKRKRRDFHCPERKDCKCPESGKLVCVCEFFACLDPDDDIKPIMGLIDVFVELGFLPCLAFAVDTTGSMGEEIEAAKEIIRNLSRSEEDSPVCYVLQPFNDLQNGFFDPASIPEATVATTYNEATSITELELFLNKTESMRAYGGGDGPERQLRALLTILCLEDPDIDGLPLMDPGSEIVLLTDHRSHDAELETDVITKARDLKVCISFYLSTRYADWPAYWRISAATGGTVVASIDRTSFLTFSDDHDYGQCARFYELSDRKKRQAPSSYDIEQRCHYFSTSLFTTTVVVTGHTSQDSMIVTKPNTDEVQVITNYRGEKIYRDPDPLSGQWSVCVETGTLTITLENADSMSTVLQYIRPIVNSTELSLKYTPPPACTEGTLSMETTKIADIGTASVQLLDDESGTVLTTAPLYRCADRLMGNITFPLASVKYRAVGNDVNGRPFIASLSKSATFVPGDKEKFRIVIEGENLMRVEYDQIITLVVTVHNLHDLNDAHYTFTAESVTGFRQAFRPTSLIVPPRENGSVNMIILQETVEPGTSHTFTATVSDGCISYSASKTVSIQLPATTTPPPADVCGCMNGGTCIIRTIRGRDFKRCACPDGFTGLHCT